MPFRAFRDAPDSARLRKQLSESRVPNSEFSSSISTLAPKASEMQRYTLGVSESPEELAFYRAVEDFFATVRGVPHVLSPKDFQLLRSWWREQLPLAAVTAGITEVFARRRDRDDDDPVVSLSYCRHAVQRHAKRLAEMHVGDAELDVGFDGPPVFEQLEALVESLRDAAASSERDRPGTAAVIERVAGQLEQTPEMPAGAVEAHLHALETVLLTSCWRSLPEDDRARIDGLGLAAVTTAGALDEVAERTRRAVRDREVRSLLGLPRLELR